MNEREWLRQFLDLAGYLGWKRHYHNLYSPGSDSGFPDLVILNIDQKRIAYVEVKGDGGNLSAEQVAWIEDLREAGGEAEVFWPEHMEIAKAWLKGEK